jgi:predicted dehydrogenase
VTDKIKWGVLGNASIARICIIPALQRSHNGVVHALATRDPENARSVAADHKIQHLYNSYDELLVDPEIDIIYNPLPNHLHHAWTLKALMRGKHVLCEKPLACSAGEAQEMVDVAAQAGLLLMESFSYRFHTAFIPEAGESKRWLQKTLLANPAWCDPPSAFTWERNYCKAVTTRD